MNLFGTSDPSKKAMSYLDRLDPMYREAYQPYIDLGKRQQPTLENQYNEMTTNPGQFVNNVGKDFTASPGYQFALQQALQGGNNAAAAGGFAGTPAHEQSNMQLASDIGNQEYYKYLSNALGQHKEGLEGMQGLFNTGYGASTGLAGNLGNLGLNKANLSYSGAQSQNQAIGGMWGGIAGLAGNAMDSPEVMAMISKYLPMAL